MIRKKRSASTVQRAPSWGSLAMNSQRDSTPVTSAAFPVLLRCEWHFSVRPPENLNYRKRRDAVTAFAEPVKRSLTAFLDGNVTAPVPTDDRPVTMSLNDGAMVPLRVWPDREPVAISVGVTYRIRPSVDADVETVGWSHALTVGETEQIRYDWHPQTTPDIKWPHAHVFDGEEHTPTGRILVEDVLLLALEYGAKPLPNRAWKDKLRASHAHFEQDGSWGTAPNISFADRLERWDEDGCVLDGGTQYL